MHIRFDSLILPNLEPWEWCSLRGAPSVLSSSQVRALSTDSTPDLVEQISGVLLDSRSHWEIQREEEAKAQET